MTPKIIHRTCPAVQDALRTYASPEECDQFEDQMQAALERATSIGDLDLTGPLNVLDRWHAIAMMRANPPTAEVATAAVAIVNDRSGLCAEDAADYHILVEHVIDTINPPDRDGAAVGICCDALTAIAEYVAALPCTCPPGAAEHDVDPCGRCVVLGRRADRRVER